MGVFTVLDKGGHLTHKRPVLLTAVLRSEKVEPLDVGSVLDNSRQLGLGTWGFLREHMDMNAVFAKFFIYIVRILVTAVVGFKSRLMREM